MAGQKRGRGSSVEHKGKRSSDAGVRGPGKTAKRPKQMKPHKAPALPEVRDSDLDVSEDDLEFVRQYGESIAFLDSLDQQQLARPSVSKKAEQKERQAAAAAAEAAAAAARKLQEPDSDEEEYERAPRQRLQDKQAEERAAVLPVKALDGTLVYEGKEGKAAAQPASLAPIVAGVTVEDAMADASEDESGSDGSEEAASHGDVGEPMDDSGVEAGQADGGDRGDDLGQEAGRVAEPTRTAGKKRLLNDVKAELQDFQNAEQRREELKTQLAVSASQLLQEPEKYVGHLQTLIMLTTDADAQVARLAILSLLAVFRDILPGYRIRPPTQKELDMPVSKEVKRTRDYEALLLRSYQAYLKQLLAAAAGLKQGGGLAQKARVAVKCMCGLLSALPHFNYTSDLLQALVPLTAHRDVSTRSMCCGAISELLRADREGAIALEAVQLVADLVKRRKCICPPEVVRTLLVLKFGDVSREDVAKAGKDKGGKKAKRKRKAKGDEVDQAFKEADAAPSLSERQRLQSQMLEALFEVMFRVLKQCTASGVAARPGVALSNEQVQKRLPLLAPSLEGLARYAHLISVEYFGDLMAIMQQLLAGSALPLSARLQVLLTAADILKGQGEALTVDRRELYTQLYAALLYAPISPLLADEQLHWDDPKAVSAAAPVQRAQQAQQAPRQAQQQGGKPSAGASSSGDMGTQLTRAAFQMLCEQGRAVDPAQLAAFIKRLGCSALQLGSGEAMGMLGVLDRLLRRNQKLRSLLEHEAGAPAWASAAVAALGLADEKVLAGAPVWELSLLTRHYHPHVAQAAASVVAMPIQGGGSVSGVLAARDGPGGLASAYSTAMGGFRPAPAVPRKRLGSQGAAHLQALRTPEAESGFAQALSASDGAGPSGPAACQPAVVTSGLSDDPESEQNPGLDGVAAPTRGANQASEGTADEDVHAEQLLQVIVDLFRSLSKVDRSAGRMARAPLRRMPAATVLLAVSLAVLLSTAVVESRRLQAPAVIDGYNTDDGRYPYNARIEARVDGSVSTCTGSLIAPTLVLTAGHCAVKDGETRDKAQFTVIVGQDSKNVGNGVTRTVSEVKPHPMYDSAARPGGYDVAILVLDQAVPNLPIKLNTVRPTNGDDGKAFKILGWGIASQEPTVRPDHLQQTTLYLRSAQKPRANFPEQSLPVSSSLTSPSDGTIPSSCSGDSGGPLLVQGATPADDVQWGSDSYGTHVDGLCGTTNAASVYMDLTFPAIRTFIEDTIKGACVDKCPEGGVEGDQYICPSKDAHTILVHCKANGDTYLPVQASDTTNYALYGPGPNTGGQTPRTQYTKDQFATNGFAAAGQATYSSNNQVVDVTGGGNCGAFGPKDGFVHLVYA
ncbi:hypothetical protein WJX72_010918 [[Myrmecia] bisecta]|uniref:Peptidase S1 domain-containing protein n=1 Tax=[Myrmecia] bisecta TaxID=41462 RepID=A0AAW1PUD1_9CHLO